MARFRWHPGTRLRVGPLLVVLLALVSPVVGQAPRIRDSAGVRIIEHGARATLPIRWTVVATPVLDVGGLNEARPELEFVSGSSSGVASFSDGGLVIAEPARLQFFDVNGRRVAVVGRRGGGPEDFRTISSLCVTRGDTVVVNDYGNRRFAVLTKTGRFVRTYPSAGDGLPGCLGDGTFLREARRLEEHRSLVTLTRMTGISLGEVVQRSTRPLFAVPVGYLGNLVATGWTVVLGTGTSADLRRIDLSGKTIQIIRTADKLRRATEAELNPPRNPAAEQRTLEMLRGRGVSNTRVVHSRYDDREFRQWVPAYGSLRGEPDGTVWVADLTITSAREFGWTAFGADGIALGRVQIPERIGGRQVEWVAGFRTGKVLLRTRDADGARHFQLHTLQRR